MHTQDIAKLEEILRQKEAQRTEVKFPHDQLALECNILRSAIDIFNWSDSEISRRG